MAEEAELIAEWSVRGITYSFIADGSDSYALIGSSPSGQPIVRQSVRCGWENCHGQGFFVSEAIDQAPSCVRRLLGLATARDIAKDPPG